MYIRNLMKTDYRTAKGKALRQHEREVERHKLLQILVSVAILTFFAFTILTKTIYDLTHPSRKPSGMIEKVEVVKAEEPQPRAFCADVIKCIRDVGEELGVSNNGITTMIRIAKCESGYRPDAMGINTNKTADRGVFQLNTIHKGISNEDAFNYELNIRYAYKMFIKQGTTPWNSSKKCWNK